MNLSIEELEMLIKFIETEEQEYGITEKQGKLVQRLIAQLDLELKKKAARRAFDELNAMLAGIDDPTIDQRYSD